MKKIYLTLGLATSILAANAQTTKHLTAQGVLFPVSIDMQAKTASTSTLTPASLSAGGCAVGSTTLAGLYSYSNNPDPGFLFGTNTSTVAQGPTTFTLAALENAQKYSATGTGITVTNVLVLAGKAKSNAGTSMVNAKIYSENTTNKKPNAQVGVTASKALNTFTTGTSFNVFTFSTPVALTAGNFFASIEAPALGGTTKDSLSILSTQFGCSSTDSLAWVHGKVIAPTVVDLGWSSVKVAYTGNTDDLDLAIFPVLDFTPITTGINSISKGNLTLLAAYPNPATNDVAFNFGLTQNSNVEIEIYDVTGKLINTIKLDNLEAGNHVSKMDVSGLNAGVYMYSVKSTNAKMFSKFTVVK